VGCARASAAPFAGMTQTGSMGLISAARPARHPSAVGASSPLSRAPARATEQHPPRRGQRKRSDCRRPLLKARQIEWHLINGANHLMGQSLMIPLMNTVVTLDGGGRVVIPKPLRDQLRLAPRGYADARIRRRKHHLAPKACSSSPLRQERGTEVFHGRRQLPRRTPIERSRLFGRAWSRNARFMT
jgi:bifunctional DNA-binding transcriptional regulator/antitoxin component of YhaV-PrlF toxin-antitoxin module